MQRPALIFSHTTEPLVTQFIESVDAGELCMLMGACMDGLVASRTPPALPPGLVVALSAAQTKMYTGAANDACDVCKVWVPVKGVQNTTCSSRDLLCKPRVTHVPVVAPADGGHRGALSCHQPNCASRYSQLYKISVSVHMN